MLGIQQAKGRRRDDAFALQLCFITLVSTVLGWLWLWLLQLEVFSFLRVELVNNLKMIKVESFIAFSIPSLQNKRNLCFSSYREHIDLIPLINDNSSRHT